MARKINQNYAVLIQTGLLFRIATQRNGKARAYFDGDWCEFWSNKINASELMAQAPHSNRGSHLDMAMADLKLRNQAKLDYWAAVQTANAEALVIGAATNQPMPGETKKSACRI